MEDPDCPECEGRGWVEDEENGGTMTCPGSATVKNVVNAAAQVK